MNLTVARIIWGTIVMSTLAFAGLPFLVPQQVTSPPPLLVPFAVLGLGLALGSLLVPRIVLRRTLRAPGFATVDAPVPSSTEQLFRESPPTRRVFSEPDQVVAIASRIYVVPVILGLALAEAISTLGLVLHVTGSAPEQIAPFFVTGTLLALLRFPSARQLNLALESTYAARLDHAAPPAGQDDDRRPSRGL